MPIEDLVLVCYGNRPIDLCTNEKGSCAPSMTLAWCRNSGKVQCLSRFYGLLCSHIRVLLDRSMATNSRPIHNVPIEKVVYLDNGIFTIAVEVEPEDGERRFSFTFESPKSRARQYKNVLAAFTSLKSLSAAEVLFMRELLRRFVRFSGHR